MNLHFVLADDELSDENANGYDFTSNIWLLNSKVIKEKWCKETIRKNLEQKRKEEEEANKKKRAR